MVSDQQPPTLGCDPGVGQLVVELAKPASVVEVSRGRSERSCDVGRGHAAPRRREERDAR
jgi:hypothetical protein